MVHRTIIDEYATAMKFNRNDTRTDTNSLLQLDHVGMDALERDKHQAYLRKIENVVDFWWETLLGRQ